jgi:hypothetical protein
VFTSAVQASSSVPIRPCVLYGDRDPVSSGGDALCMLELISWTCYHVGGQFCYLICCHVSIWFVRLHKHQ